MGTERKRKWWFRAFGDTNAMAREYAKAHGFKAHGVMSRCVVSVKADAELRDVADILDKHRIKRVPVMEEGRLVGIVTRGDLVRALSQVQVPRRPRWSTMPLCIGRCTTVCGVNPGSMRATLASARTTAWWSFGVLSTPKSNAARPCRGHRRGWPG